MNGLPDLPTPGESDPEASPGVDTAAIAGIVRTRLFEDQPHRIGRFTVLERLGAGGMGVVYAAFDPELDRRVAIKLLSAGSGDSGRLAREAQIMARLNHPNVAQIYEVGRHGDATWVAMEHVRGRTLRAWVNEAQPNLRERMAALVQAGRGLAAAHAAGVIHRDFKPDNVMMGDDGRVRVLDFGLARDLEPTDMRSLEEPSAADHASLASEPTPTGSTVSRAGTPAYMAPEQWRGEPVDARSDVYAFCLTAWEVLTGQRPFAEASLEQLRRDGGAERELPRASALPRRVERVLRRGLASDRDARPANVDAVVVELGRDPTVARRRVVLVVASLAAVAGTWAWQRAQALRHESGCAAEAESIAETWNADRADRIASAFADTKLDFAADAFDRARSRIDAFTGEWSAVRLDVCLAEEPTTSQAATACLDDAHTRLQVLLERLSTPEPAIVPMAVSAAVALPDPRACTDPRSALRYRTRAASSVEATRRLVEIEVMLQTAAYEEALAAADAAIDAAEDEAEAAPVQLAKGNALRQLGRHPAAREAFEIAFYDAGAAGDDLTAMNAATELVDIVGFRLTDPARGREWSRTARMYLQRLGLENDPAAAAIDVGVGKLLAYDGSLDEALVSHRRALELREATYGPNHPTVASSLAYIGTALCNRGDVDEGVATLRRALAVGEASLGPDHPDVARMCDALGEWLHQRGEYEEALALHQRALAIKEAVLGPDNESVGETLMDIAALDVVAGRYESALAGYQRALDIAEASFEPDHPRIAGALVSLGRAYEMSGDTDTAMSLYRRGLDVQERAVAPDDVRLAPILAHLGFLLMNNREHDEAAVLLRRAEKLVADHYGRDNGDRSVLLGGLASIETSRGQPEAAVELLEEALGIAERAGLSADRRADIEYQLGRALLYAGRDLDRALQLAERAAEDWRTMGPAKVEYVGYAEALIGAIDKRRPR